LARSTNADFAIKALGGFSMVAFDRHQEFLANQALNVILHLLKAVGVDHVDGEFVLFIFDWLWVIDLILEVVVLPHLLRVE
jgi:hypothetical protein